MQIEVPDQTVRDVESMLAKQGVNIDVATFVDQTLQRAMYFATVRAVKERNATVSAAELIAEIDEAVTRTRAAARKESPRANGS